MNAKGAAPIALLAALPAEQRAEIMAAATHQSFEAGASIVTENDETTDIFLILSGRAAVKAFSEQGYEVAYLELADGACFGEFSAIDGEPRAATVEALTDVAVARLQRRAFRAFVERFPALGLTLAEHLVARARALSARIFEFSTLPVRSRVRLELLRLVRQKGLDKAGLDSSGPAHGGGDRVVIKPAPTHQEIAARISTHREAVSREMAALAAQNLVLPGRQTIEVVSVRGLRRAAREQF